MSELLSLSIVLVCPLGMAAMMGLPALGRLFRRRDQRASVRGE